MRRFPVAVAIVVLMALGACGDKDDESSSDSSSSSGASTDESKAFEPCTAVTDDEVAQIMGHAVTKKEDPGGGCTWGNEDDPRLASLSLSVTPADQGGGIESSKVGTRSVLNGEAADTPGLGDAAYLVVGTGKEFAKEQVQAQGVIESGGQLVTVGITQLGGAAESEVQSQAGAAMALVASKF